jgi:hypothetical protein
MELVSKGVASWTTSPPCNIWESMTKFVLSMRTPKIAKTNVNTDYIRYVCPYEATRI